MKHDSCGKIKTLHNCKQLKVNAGNKETIGEEDRERGISETKMAVKQNTGGGKMTL